MYVMKRWTVRIAAAVVASVTVFAQPAATPPPAKERFHLFLLVGQSNMAGRGAVDAEDRAPHPRLLMLGKSGQWTPAVDPMHFDKPIAGVGLGKTFGVLMAEANPGVVIGLIPCAVGGSPIDAWRAGAYYQPTQSHPWDDAMARARIALKDGVLKGILWHQGESDSTPELANAYEAKLHALIALFRKELSAERVPFLAGQLGQFEGAAWNDSRKLVDKAHRDLPGKVKLTAFVSSEGLKDKGDKTHFDTPSYKEFGKRYFTSFQKIASAH
jgi:hypothetical protein